MNTTDYVDNVLGILSKPLFDVGNDTVAYKRATEDKETLEMLQVEKRDGTLTDDVTEFLDEHNGAERHFLSETIEILWGLTHLNPREKNKYKKYFVDDDARKLQFEDLLTMNEKTTNLKIFDNKVTLLLGKKGMGKTITQNVWLYTNHKKLEELNIFWVRLDVEELYKLWKKGKEITTEEYFIGQLLYVFCKRFIPFEPVDKTNMNVEYTYTNSSLITRIYDRLNDNPEENIIYHNDEKVSKNEIKSLKDAEILFNQKLKRQLKTQASSKITDYLRVLEEIIAKYEKTYKSDGNKRLAFAPNRKLNYLIDSVFEDKDSVLFKMWMYLGNLLKTFILQENYHILYMVDGIDNINFENFTAVNDYVKLLNQLLIFPLSKKKVAHKNERMFLALRYNTWEDLKKHYYMSYGVYREYHDLENSKKIKFVGQKDGAMAMEILKKRIDYIIEESHWCKKSYMAHVLNVIRANDKVISMQDDEVIQDYEEKLWNSNYRTFLHNQIMLAKYITFRYYWSGKSDGFRVETEKRIRDHIEREIRTYKDINFYLNGEMYACDKNRRGDNDGVACFNLFGFVGKTRPLYFIYTYILLIIRSLSEHKKSNRSDTVSVSDIVAIMNCLKFDTEDIIACIDKLVIYGMLEQYFQEDSFQSVKGDGMLKQILENKGYYYNITEKGKFLLHKFYNDIQYLYYSCLDTKLPEVVFDEVKKSISPNNVHFGENRNFLPNCVITGISFLNYLKFESDLMLGDKKIEETLLEYGISREDLQLPIFHDNADESKSQSLRDSVNQIVGKFIPCRNENGHKILEEWLRNKSVAKSKPVTETLEISNFFTIKKAKYEFKQFNIITGDMASGKSLCMKLMAFFENIIPDLLSKEQLGEFSNLLKSDVFFKGLIEEFNGIFDLLPNTQPFEITYTFSYGQEKFTMSITNTKEKGIIFESSDLEELLENWRAYYLQKINNTILTTSGFNEIKRYFYANLRKKFDGYFPIAPTFMPASRAGLAVGLKSSEHIDKYFVKYSELHGILLQRFDSKNNNEIKKTLKAQIKIHDGLLYLESLDDGRKTHISKASSGQQEIAPVLMLIDILDDGFRDSNYAESQSIFIEEPEAQLFPLAQKQVIEFIARVYCDLKQKGKIPTRFFITTHSPYVLDVINNMLMKGRLEKQYNEEKQLEKIRAKVGFPALRAEELSAIFIKEDGTLDDPMLNIDKEQIYPCKIQDISFLIDEDANSLDELNNELTQKLIGGRKAK